MACPASGRACAPACHRRALAVARRRGARHGWWLGPELGRQWPRVAPLFAFAPEPQRVALLDLLRAADTEDIDALERLAQITPPEERDALRSDLLRVPAAQRRTWMLEKVQG